DWWNGNRSVLADADLTGIFVGLTLHTKPEELYRAMLESTAYGARTIIEAYKTHGVQIDEIYAAGGIPGKNPLLMQIYADVLGLPIQAAKNPPSAGLGSAVFAAVAAGAFGTVEEAAKRLVAMEMVTYVPDPQRAARYDVLYEIYGELHAYFGVTNRGLMKQLREL
ncbi:MAG: ribulokinase, partial [Firmicutes bacterium]|nr:ribulokinase [Bacillota bacterium]